MLVPLYKSENHLSELFPFLWRLDSEVSGGINVLFVIDGRHEDKVALADELNAAKFDLPVSIITLSRNFGVGPALHAGIANSLDSCAVAGLGSDLQEPVSLYMDFFSDLASGNSDIALGYRISRQDPLLTRLFSSIYWRVVKTWINPEVPLLGYDAFAFTSKVAREFVKLRELNTSFTSQLLWIGYRINWFGFDRVKRVSGKSSWSFRRKIKLFSDSVYGFTSKPLSLIMFFGLFSSGIFAILSTLAIISKIFGLGATPPGFTTLILAVGLGQSLTIFSVGIVGNYIFRIFENTAKRPNYIIQSEEHLPRKK